MTNFSDVNLTGSTDRRNNWQKHHVVPTAQFGSTDLARLFQAIQNPALPLGIRYDHELFDFNGLLLPEGVLDSLAFGFALHNGSHPGFSSFVERILSDIQTELETRVLTAEQAARSVRGFQAYLIDKLTIDGFVNPLTGDQIAHAGFFLDYSDPWLAVLGETDNPARSAAVYDGITLDSIRGATNATNPDLSLPFWQGYNSGTTGFDFSGFDYANRSGSIYDPYFKYENGVYASSVERYLARVRSVGLDQVTDFIELRLGEFLVNQFDGYRPEVLILNNVTFFQNGADYTKNISQLTSNIESSIEVSPNYRDNTLLIIGAVGPFRVDMAYAPNGFGAIVAAPNLDSLKSFFDLSDELNNSLPDFAYKNEIISGLKKATDWYAGYGYNIYGYLLSGVEFPNFTVASDGVSGLGHSGADLMLGLGSSKLTGQGGDDWIVHLGSGEVHGNEGNDKILGIDSDYLGAGQALDLHGGDGDDVLGFVFGAGGFAYGDAGDDTLIGGGAESHLYGGSGSDAFYIGSNTFIEDADAGDAVKYAGIEIFGGVKQWWMEAGTAYSSPYSSILQAFPVIGSSILGAAALMLDLPRMAFVNFRRDQNGDLRINIAWGFGGSALIRNYNLDLDSGVATGGVAVFQQENTFFLKNYSGSKLKQYLNLALYAGFGHGFPGYDPLVLDLDGDGYELTTEANSKAYFEFDSDGFAERTGWVRGDDALLARDANGNGKIDGIAELFGNQTTSGFTMLAAFDGNGDGIINASDAVYSELRVWQDANQDGVSDAGELRTLSEAGIVSINLASSAPGTATAVGGNQIVRTSSFTRADGTTGGIADVAFDISETATKWLGDSTVSASAALLPELRGFGEVKDLRVAMTGNAALESMVADFVSNVTTDLGVLKSDAEAILYTWAGVDGVAATALGTGGFDTRKLAFLEKYSGSQLMPRDGNGAIQLTNIAEMEELWADQVTRLTLRLVVQGPMAAEFAGITYRTDFDLLVADSAAALGDLYARVLADLPTSSGAALTQWQAWAPLLGAMAESMVRFDNNIVRDDFIAAQLLAAMDGVAQPLDYSALAGALGLENLRLGTNSSDTLTRGGASGTAIYLSSGGNDTLTGGTGQDVYVFGRAIGNVVINDEEAKPAGDRIRFSFLNETDVTLSRSANDLLITVNATGETIRVTGQFAPVVPLSSDVLLSTDKGIEEIQFADGTIFEIPEIMTAVGTGTSGNDTMVGTMHSDVFLGGLGDDTMLGGDDADLYVIEAGDGHDTIRDVQTTPLLRAADMVIFGDNIAPQDLTFSRSGSSGQNLLITIGGAGQSLLVEGQFGYSVLGYNAKLAPNNRIEAFGFRDYGESWSNKDIQQMLLAQATTDGDDVTLGFGDDDIFAASAGNDTLVGLDGNDRYYWGRGYGNDTIDERALYIDVDVGMMGLSLDKGADTVVFMQGITAADVTFSRAPGTKDLVVTLDSGETLTVKNQFNGFQTGPLGAQWFDRMEWFEFADGTRLSWQDVLLDITTGGDGDDTLIGDLYQDTLTGGRGNDYLSGGGYADTYTFNLGDGHDTVNDNNQFILGEGFVSVDTSPDVLRLGVGITSADIGFEFDKNNMTLLVGTNGDAVTLQGQNNYYNTGVFGAISNSRIERVEFADGEVWTWQAINARAIASKTTSGDDLIIGFDMADRFAASAGNDIMRGGNSGDVYEFGIGSGQDRIEESVDDVFFGDDDAVEFAAGLTTSDITYERDGDDLIVKIAGTNDQLTVAGQFANYIGYTNNDVERFVFADGTVTTKDDIMALLTVGSAGNDAIEGFYINDTIVGGTGDDELYGRDGSDRYLFNLGDGHDTIHESVEFVQLAENDRIIFGAGIAPSDIVLSRSGNSLTLAINGTNDSVTIDGQYAFANGFTWNDIEFVEFADGTVWTKREMANMLMGGTAGNDTILGTFENDDINGLGGDDLLKGGDGSDTYYFSRGDGHDTIQESVTNAIISDFDQIVFGENISAADLTFVRNGDDLTIGISGTSDAITIVGQFDNYVGSTSRDIEQLQFADGSVMTIAEIRALLTIGTAGNDVIAGFHTDDTLDGGAGDDVLQGRDGSDTYLFGRGSGHDTINESVEFVNLTDNDRILFGPGVSQSDVTFSRDGNDLLVTINDTGDSIRIAGEFSWSGGFTWSDIERFDFEDGSSLTKQDVQNFLLTPTSGDDTITGFGSADVIRGAGGNDALFGKDGNDTYVWAHGDGNDTITEGVQGGVDTVLLEGINPDSVTLTRSSNTLYVTIAESSPGAGDGGTLTFFNSVNENFNEGVDRLQFADGTIWNRSTFQAILADTAGTDGDDTILGTAGNDVLAGRKGNDILTGSTGNDTYVFNLGDGQDIIRDNTINVLNGGNDTLQFGPGIAPTDITVTQNSNGTSLLISINGTTDSVLLDNDINNDDYRIEQVRFDDGTVLTHAELMSLATAPTSGNDTFYGSYDGETLDGGAGDDTLDARSGNDTLIGGTGNDILIGNVGNDTYVFNLGDGQDIIRDNTANVLNGGSDTLQFGPGIAPTDITVTQNSNGTSLLISINGTTDSVLLDNDINNDDYRIEQVRFDDGTVLTHAALMSLATAPTSGDDTFYGSYDGETLDGGAGNDILSARDGNDTLIGDTGNDILTGSTGNDTYLFNLGDGQDIIRDNTVNVLNGGNDTLQFGAGIAPNDITVTQTLGGNSLLISINSTTDSVLIENTINNDDYRIEQVQFHDGTVLTHAELLALATTPTAGDDLIYLGSGNDVIAGGGGNDTIDGGGGNDTFQVSGSGDGFDAITGGAGTDTIQAMANGTVIGLTNISTVEAITANGFSGVTISGSGGADTLNLGAVTLTGVDRIDGGGGNDTITGPAAGATIAGGTGDDTITGGAGNDMFLFGGTSDGFDAITGGAGTDTIAATANDTVIGLHSLSTVEAITAGGYTGVTISGSSNADTLNFSSVTLTGISRIDGGAGADVITGPATAAIIAGGADDDTLTGGAGNDTFLVTGTADGFDAITGGAGTDTIQATADNTVIGLRSLATVEVITAGGFSGVTISGSSAADTLNFSAVTLTGIGRIDGGAGNDTITGSATAATIAGGAGDDTITGGAGNDTFLFGGTGDGFDAITGGAGTDTIAATGNDTVIGLRSLATVEAISAGGFTGVTISGSSGSDTLNFSTVTLTGITRIDGGVGNDTITGPATAATFVGGAGDDTITGGAGNDTFLFGGTSDGFDAITGGAGTDTIAATADNTVIGLRSLATVETITSGGFTGVTISGSAAANTLNFSSVTLTGITSIDGGAGNDVITGSAGNDTLIGGAGNDTLNGGAGIDTVDYSYLTSGFSLSLAVTTAQSVATGDSDILSNIENVIGGAGDDNLTGTAGNNVLSGGLGDDRLTGGLGDDTLMGGAGSNDVAVFAGLQASYSIATSNGVVTVVDNQPTTDGNDSTDTINGIEKVEFKGGVQVGVTSPIILDLDGHGIVTTAADQSTARFDLDGDGILDRTSWIGSTEGFLFIDRDGNGTLSGANELSFTSDVPDAASDLVGLRAFDSNGDGQLSDADNDFAKFKVWQDANGDGRVTANEILTLAEAGVASLSLSASAVNGTTALGDVAIVNVGSYQRTDGTTMQFADAVLTYFAGSIAPTPRGRQAWLDRGSIGRLERPFEIGIHDVVEDSDLFLGFGEEQGSTFDPVAFMNQASGNTSFDSLINQLAGTTTQARSSATSSQLSIRTMDMPVEAVAALDGLPGGMVANAAHAGEAGTARLLSLLRQDMASFNSGYGLAPRALHQFGDAAMLV